MSQRRWIAWARVTASILVLVVVLRRAHLTSLELDWEASNIAWLTSALVVTFVAVVLSAVRWQKVLTALGLSARIPTLLRHHLAGLFVSSFLPSTVGGDVLRVSRLAASNGEAPRTFASVVLERLTGWLVLPVITLVALAINPGLFGADVNTRFALVIALVTLGGLAVVLWAAGVAASPLGKALGGPVDRAGRVPVACRGAHDSRPCHEGCAPSVPMIRMPRPCSRCSRPATFGCVLGNAARSSTTGRPSKKAGDRSTCASSASSQSSTGASGASKSPSTHGGISLSTVAT